MKIITLIMKEDKMKKIVGIIMAVACSVSASEKETEVKDARDVKMYDGSLAQSVDNYNDYANNMGTWNDGDFGNGVSDAVIDSISQPRSAHNYSSGSSDLLDATVDLLGATAEVCIIS